MIRDRARTNDRLVVIVPNMYAMAVIPPGTKLEVVGYAAANHELCYVDVVHMPAAPEEYNVVVPKGSVVNVVEE